MELNAEQVRTKARAAQSLATQLGGVKLAGPMDQVAGALPGARAKQAASTLGDTWVERVRNLAADVDAHADALWSSVNQMQSVGGHHRGHLERSHDWPSATPTWAGVGQRGPVAGVPLPGGAESWVGPGGGSR